MAKKQTPWAGLALLVGLGFAWSKLGLGAAAKEIGLTEVFRREYPTMQETGYLTQAEWQARYGGSQLDYEDWLRGQ